jgi:hypothetical protein
MPARIRLRIGKFWAPGPGNVPKRNSLMTAPRWTNLLENLLILLGVNHVDAAGEAAGYDEAAVGQIPGQALSHLIPVGGWTARADDRDDVAAQKLNVSAHIQERRRIVDLLEALGVLGLVPREQSATCRLYLSQLLGGIADGATRVEGLGDRSGEALALESGE